MTQRERVVNYISKFGSISSLEAFRDLGVTRLSAVIFDLRHDGYEICGEMEATKNRFGETVHYMRYSFERS